MVIALAEDWLCGSRTFDSLGRARSCFCRPLAAFPLDIESGHQHSLLAPSWDCGSYALPPLRSRGPPVTQVAAYGGRFLAHALTGLLGYVATIQHVNGLRREGHGYNGARIAKESWTSVKLENC
jgi:hypothetical protein